MQMIIRALSMSSPALTLHVFDLVVGQRGITFAYI